MEDASEAETVDDFCQFLAQHYGSVLRAWRWTLDPSGDGELLYSEFIEAVASMPRWHGDVTGLWATLMRRARTIDDDAVLRLRELSKEDYDCLESFKRWADTTFGGALQVFKEATHGAPNAMMTFQEFEATCIGHNFGGDCEKIFYNCFGPEASEKGASIRDVAYLESKAIKRKEAMYPDFVLQQASAKAAAKRIRHRKQRLQRAQQQALQEFLHKVRKASGGSLIRGWRRVLDHNGNLLISKRELLKGCKKIAFSGDVVALWKAMDVDDDGIVQLEEVDVQLALVLATFKKWATEENGSCGATLVQLGNYTKRQTSKWDLEGFAEALRASGFSTNIDISQKQTAAILYEAFDVENLGYFTIQDVTFLDTWSPTPWLIANPWEEGKERFMKALRNRYPNLLVAWRRLLDRDNSNRVSYKVFENVCRLMKIPNSTGIWRILDDDHSGYISLSEIDQEAADTLLGFKRWAEDVFGTITRMFHVLDKSKSGKVSFQVFKRALRNFGFEGDASVLFQSLKPSTSGTSSKKNNHRHELILQDLLYLSSWESHPGSDYLNIDEDDMGKQIAPKATAPAPAANSSCPPRYERSRLKDGGVAPRDTNKKHVSSPVHSPSRTCLPAISPKHEPSEAMSFCRSVDEYRAFLEARSRQRLANAYGTKFTQGLLQIPQLQAAVASKTPTASHALKVPIAHAGSKSMGRLPALPRMLPEPKGGPAAQCRDRDSPQRGKNQRPHSDRWSPSLKTPHPEDLNSHSINANTFLN